MDQGRKNRRRKRERVGEERKSRSHRRQKNDPKKSRRSNSDSALSSSSAPEHPRSALSLTPNAVKSIATGSTDLLPNSGVNPEKSRKKLIVRLRLERHDGIGNEDNALVAVMSDGKHYMNVLVLNPMELLSESYTLQLRNDWIVSVHGYVTTEGQSTKYQLTAVVCLTSLTVLSTPQNHNFSLGTPFPIPSPNPTTRVHAGTIGSFMANRAPFLTNEELAGSSDLYGLLEEGALKSRTDESSKVATISLASHQENSKTVAQFLQHHSAMTVLKTSTASQTISTSSDETPRKRPADHAVQSYTSGVKEFSLAQLNRQKASLGTNAGREAADRASLITEQHNAALEDILKEDIPLTIPNLCSWHKSLLKDLHPAAGKIRTKTVRAGQTVFAPPGRIEEELSKLFSSLQSLEARLDMGNAGHAILFTAVAMYGVVDIHPFADGNGRLSRMVANWALRKAGLPFPVNLFATPAQRAEYVLALEKTRHFLSFTMSHGTASRDNILQGIKHLGVFSPLIRLLMDRVAKAVVECNRILEEKSGLAAEAAEARAARRARERASQGTCIICFDETPNIATLCCGGAVHLNCIAEWLGGQNSCPVCRSAMPGISGRVVRAASRDFMAEENNNHRSQNQENLRNARDVIVSLLSPFDTTTSADDASDDIGEEDFTTTMSDEESEDEEPSAPIQRAPTPAENNDNEDTTTTFEDTTTTSDSDDSSDVSEDSNRRSNTANDNDEDTSETTTNSDSDGGNPAPSQPPAPHHCSAIYCRNRPAVDCTNQLCGRCCVLSGQFHCPRHNS